MNSAKHINILRGIAEIPLRQRGYQDQIIRDSVDLERIREYIINNPSNWDSDDHFPENIHPDPATLGCLRITHTTVHSRFPESLHPAISILPTLHFATLLDNIEHGHLLAGAW